MVDLIKNIASEECLFIWSKNDLSFEDFMNVLGCKAYVFDGFVNNPAKRGKSIYSENIFVGPENIETKIMQTIPTILASYGHAKTKISDLKLVIEDREIKLLPNAIDEGSLTAVQQIEMGLRLNVDAKRTNILILLLNRLYCPGNCRLILYDVNGYDENVAKTALNTS